MVEECQGLDNLEGNHTLEYSSTLGTRHNARSHSTHKQTNNPVNKQTHTHRAPASPERGDLQQMRQDPARFLRQRGGGGGRCPRRRRQQQPVPVRHGRGCPAQRRLQLLSSPFQRNVPGIFPYPLGSFLELSLTPNRKSTHTHTPSPFPTPLHLHTRKIINSV